MTKEFCIQYPVYAPVDKQYADDLAVIKIKDGDKITEKEICSYKTYDYADMLEELGYRRVYLKRDVDYEIEQAEERVKKAEKELETHKILLENKKSFAEKNYYNNLCNWFYDD